MKRAAVISLSVVLACLSLSGAGLAQPPASVEVQGVIQAIDCHASTVTLQTQGGISVYHTAESAAIVVNSAAVPLCALEQHVGSPANVWLTPVGNEFVVTRIETAGGTYEPSAAPPAPAPSGPYPAYPSPYPAYPYPGYAYPYPGYAYPYPYYYPAVAGVVLGTIVVGGLTYLLAHGPYGYYRYPYYGAYYHYYYRPAYHPYYGGSRYAPAFTWTGRGWHYGR
jgi:hypothetical protein